MKINKLHNKYIFKKTLGYIFTMYKHKDDNNNICFTLTVKNRILKLKEHVILTNPTYIVGMFDGKIREYIFDVIEQAINLKIDSLGLSDVLYIEKNVSCFTVNKYSSVIYECLSIPDYDNYDKLYANLEDVVVNNKNYF